MKPYRKPKSGNIKEQLERYRYKKEEREGNINLLNMFRIMTGET